MNNAHRQKGAALFVFIIFFTIACTSLVLILARGIYSDRAAVNTLEASKQSFALADGLVEDMAYRYISGFLVWGGSNRHSDHRYGE